MSKAILLSLFILSIQFKAFAGIFGPNLSGHSVTAQSINGLKCPLMRPDFSEVRQFDYLSIFKHSKDYRSYNYGFYEFKFQSEEAINIFKAFYKNKLPSNYTSCESVECLLQASFGQDWVLYVFLYLRYNINISPYAVSDTQPWTSHELESILQTIQNLPPFMFPQPQTLNIVHQNIRTQGIAQRDEVANYHTGRHTIRVNSLWDHQYDTIKIYYLTHEIAHSFGHIFNLHYSQEWLGYSDWKRNNKGAFEADDEYALTSRYSKVDPAEDFAESFAAFRFNPNGLLNSSKKKFDYLKNVLFGGLTYDSGRNCRTTNSFYQSQDPNNEADLVEIESICSFPLIAFRAKRGPKEDYLNCIDRNLYKVNLYAQKPSHQLDPKYEKIINSMNDYPNLKYLISRDELLSDIEEFLDFYW